MIAFGSLTFGYNCYHNDIQIGVNDRRCCLGITKSNNEIETELKKDVMWVGNYDLRYMFVLYSYQQFDRLLFRCFALLQSYVPIVRACVFIRPPAIVAKHDNTHVCKTSFPPRSDSDLGFHCKRAVAETFPEWRGVIRASSRSIKSKLMNLQ